MTATVTNLRGEREYVHLPKPVWEGRMGIGTGVWLEGLFRGPRTCRMFTKTDSIWEDRLTHGVVGTTYYEVDISEWVDMCDRVGINPQVEAVEV